MYKEYRHKYPINCTEPGKIFVLILHYNGSNSLFSVNAVKIYQFKREDSKIKQYPLHLGNNSSDFYTHLHERKIENFFADDYDAIDANYILDIHRCLMKET